MATYLIFYIMSKFSWVEYINTEYSLQAYSCDFSHFGTCTTPPIIMLKESHSPDGNQN